MFTTIAIPSAVHREILAKSGMEARRLDAALAQFIEIVAEPELSPAIKTVIDHLDDGEQQAIALAYARNTTLVIDERLGRQAARQLGLRVTGSVGVLIEAKQRGYIPAVRPLLGAACQQCPFYFIVHRFHLSLVERTAVFNTVAQPQQAKWLVCG